MRIVLNVGRNADDIQSDLRPTRVVAILTELFKKVPWLVTIEDVRVDTGFDPPPARNPCPDSSSVGGI